MAAKRPRTGSLPPALPTEEMEEDLDLVHFRSLQHDAQHKTTNQTTPNTSFTRTQNHSAPAVNGCRPLKVVDTGRNVKQPRHANPLLTPTPAWFESINHVYDQDQGFPRNFSTAKQQKTQECKSPPPATHSRTTCRAAFHACRIVNKRDSICSAVKYRPWSLGGRPANVSVKGSRSRNSL